MSRVISFSYNYDAWLAAGGEINPGIVLNNETAWLLEGYQLQVRGIALQTDNFGDNSNPTFYLPDTFPDIGNNYSGSNNFFLAGLGYERAGTFAPGFKFPWPTLVTVAQFGLINLGGVPPTPLTGRLTLCCNPIVFDTVRFLIQGFITVSL